MKFERFCPKIEEDTNTGHLVLFFFFLGELHRKEEKCSTVIKFMSRFLLFHIPIQENIFFPPS